MTSDVSFEISKLLKEKGFEDMIKSYDENGKPVNVSLVIRKHVPTQIFFPRSTIAEVVMWLYEKYDTWWDVRMEKGYFSIYDIRHVSDYRYSLDDLYFEKFKTPGEAYKAAIKYVLTSII